MSQYDSTSAESILEFAKLLIGKDVASFLPEKYKERGGKGKLGQLIEEHYFHKPLDNDSKPDFPLAGVELKVTPIRKMKKKSISSKERLVLGIIDYHEIINETWENSHFLKKNSLLLLVFYLYEEEKLPIQYIIKIVELFALQDYQDDLRQIQKDWLDIKEKVKSGFAHELSESDTLYLGACTKGDKAVTSFCNQPVPCIIGEPSKPAKRRAFSFKRGYMDFILWRIGGMHKEYESIFSVSGRKGNSIIEQVNSLFSPFIGNSAEDIGKMFNIPYNNQKDYCAILSEKMLGVKSLNKISEFGKANIQPKTIRVSQDGIIQESISFPAFKFKELIKEKNWEDSDLYNLLEGQKFLFIIFRITTKTVADFKRLTKEEQNKFLVFERFSFWNAPLKDIDNLARNTWEDTKRIIEEGVVIIQKKKGSKMVDFNNLPHSQDTEMVHVRPHGVNKDDVDILPNGRFLTKQCFWLNKDYIKKQLGL